MAFFRRKAEGVPTEVREALRELLLPPLGGQGADVIEYVVSGKDASCLGAMKPGLTGRLFVHSQVRKPSILRMSRAIADLDTDVLLRWAQVLEAGAAGWGARWAMGDVGGRRWPEAVLRIAHNATADGEPFPFTADDLGRLLETDGASLTELLVASLVVTRDARWADQGGRPALARLPGWGQVLLDHEAAVVAVTDSGGAEPRDQALSQLQALDADGLAAFAPTVVRAATANAQLVRERGIDLLGRLDPAVAQEALREVATAGKPDERARALDLLHDAAVAAGDDAGRAWAEERAGADRAASVKALLEVWSSAETVVEVEEIVVPDLPPVDWAVPADVVDALLEPLAARLQPHHDRVDDAARRIAAEKTATTGKHADPVLMPRVDALVDALREALLSAEPVTAPLPDVHRYRQFPGRCVGPVIGRGGAVAAVQLLRALDLLPGEGSRYYDWPDAIDRVHAAQGGPGLDRWQQLLDGVGIPGAAAIWTACQRRWGAQLAARWPADDVWPFVARNLDDILAGRNPDRRDGVGRSGAFYRAMAAFPTTPAHVADEMYDVALGTQKSDRERAQAALARDPARAARAVAGLADGRGDVRGAAAQWLARIADPATLPAVQAAWTKEKQDVVRGHLLDALDALGEPVGDYLDVPGTTKIADKLVARVLPAALSWVAWDAVPEVRWASDDQPVPRSVVQWLAATAVKGKTPEPGALLRRYAELVRPDDREALGAHLLAAWMAEDLKPIPIAEAESLAQRSATSYVRWYGSQPDSPYHGKTVEEVTAMLLPAFARRPAGSASASKGLLALVAATAGRDVVTPTERYLKEWYGGRAAQGKALIAMLAWIDDPAATQLMLSVGSRFRTKSFQQEAARQAEALAERKGWTVDELADRTIPTAGFVSTDSGAVLELSYGERVFTARLLPDLTVSLHDPDGKAIKSLPQPRQSDDADLVKDSRRAFTAAKKDLKGIATLQTERLYEALCTGRSWPVDDWQRYLVGHPVVGPAVRRLVWVEVDADGADEAAGQSFRPLDDGTLTDVDDEPVTLAAGSRVRLAHDSVLPAETVQAWLAHLADYEVDPLFQQLGKPAYELDAERGDEVEITDYVGHVVQSFTLRGRALKAGYTRGPTEDAGWFYSYRKRFPTLGLVAQLGFSGNFVPEENRAVALTELSFHREVEERLSDLALRDVPAVLLSEVVGDLRSFAADGTGFDPDWQRTTAY